MTTLPGLLLLALLIAAGLAFGQLPHYVDVAGLPNSLPAEAAAFVILVGTTLYAASAGIAVALAGMVAGWPRLGLRLATAWMIWIGVYGWCELVTHASTRNHLAFYLQFLLEPEVGNWGGSPRDWLTVIGTAGARALVVGAVAIAAAVLVAAWRERRGLSRGALAIPWLACVLLGLPVALWSPYPMAINRLVGELPLTLPLPTFALPAQIGDLVAQAERVYARHFATRGARTTPDVRRLAAVSVRPSQVVIVVLDSLRPDVLLPQHMPRLAAWSRRGTSFRNHYADANTTIYGFFSLVRGRYALDTSAVWNDRVASPFAQTAKRLGYRPSMYLSCDPKWGNIRLSAGWDDWEFHDWHDGETWTRDAASIAAAREQIATGAPRLLFLFAMSTHFPYSASPETQVTDDASTPAVDGYSTMPEGYRAAARFLDERLGDWLDGLDPARTLVVLTGDHAESFGEDGAHLHGSAVSTIQTHVPFVVVGPGIPAGHEEPALTEHADVVPTILSLMGVPSPELHGFDGRPMFERERVSRPFATIVPVQSTEASLRTIGFLSPEQGFEFQLGWDRPSVGWKGVLLPTGGYDPTPLSQDKAVTFLRWFDDFLGRFADVPR